MSIYPAFVLDHSTTTRVEVYEARTSHCADICQAIADCLTQGDYLAWVDSQPVHGFFDAACAKLLELLQPAMEQDGTEASPIISGGEVLFRDYVTQSIESDELPF
jgi:hypothetical protein